MILPQLRHCRTGSSSTKTKSLPQRSRVATLGGMVQAIPKCLLGSAEAGAYGVTQQEVEAALKSANPGTAAPSLELAGARVMVRAFRLSKSLRFPQCCRCGLGQRSSRLLLGQVATIQLGQRCAWHCASWMASGEVGRRRGHLRSGKEMPRCHRRVKDQLDQPERASLPARRGGGHHL